MAEFTDSYRAEATKEIMDEWGDKISAIGGRLIDGDVQFEFMEV
jgi:hypothetical protein